MRRRPEPTRAARLAAAVQIACASTRPPDEIRAMLVRSYGLSEPEAAEVMTRTRRGVV
ncbi:hypothetical protein [Qipengyuania thermophila]|uniref:hypothetical protein n=1 Tax=Qipengyuania thermophila TaxID=2509361 RepID=UPI0013ED1EE8|nr:hypothetical protein [Qipengyuania thermophila]